MNGGRRDRTNGDRDMEATPFATILARLLERVPGAFAAALVDVEGETVDYAGEASAFDIRVAAAHAQILLAEIGRYAKLGEPRWIVVRGAKRSIVARALPDGYGLAVLLRRRAGFTASSRAFAACERELAEEAGWKRPVSHAEQEWFPVDVTKDRLGRPRRLGKTAVTVLGELVGLPPHEHGFRIRTADGNEITLVREAGSFWYADEPHRET